MDVVFGTDKVEIVVAHHECATLRVGDRHEIAQLTKIDLGHESSLPCRGGMAFDAEIRLSRRAVAPEESNP